MSTTSDCKRQLSQRHILAGSATSGIGLMSQRGIAVERFAVLRFRQFLANARLQSDVVDRLHRGGGPRVASTLIFHRLAQSRSLRNNHDPTQEHGPT